MLLKQRRAAGLPSEKRGSSTPDSRAETTSTASAGEAELIVPIKQRFDRWQGAQPRLVSRTLVCLHSVLPFLDFSGCVLASPCAKTDWNWDAAAGARGPVTGCVTLSSASNFRDARRRGRKWKATTDSFALIVGSRPREGPHSANKEHASKVPGGSDVPGVHPPSVPRSAPVPSKLLNRWEGRRSRPHLAGRSSKGGPGPSGGSGIRRMRIVFLTHKHQALASLFFAPQFRRKGGDGHGR